MVNFGKIVHIVLFAALGSGPAIGAVDDGLVSCYNLDRNALDGSGNGRNGVIVGFIPGAVDRHGNSGGAVSFEGSASNYIEVPFDSGLYPSEFSVASWFKTATPTRAALLSSNPDASGTLHGISLQVGDGTNEYAFFYLDESSQAGDGQVINGGADVVDDSWHFVVGTFDANFLMTLYVDGVAVSTYTTAGYAPTTSSMFIGRTPDSSVPRPFSGAIDDVRLYDRAISAAEVVSLYNKGEGSSCPQSLDWVEQSQLRSLLKCVQYVESDTNGVPAIYVGDSGGCNLHVRNGGGATDSPVNSAGNLFIGYNENLASRPRGGSHNLVVGKEHGYSAHSGVVGGEGNQISARGASILGGSANVASGTFSAILGGATNIAGAANATVVGGKSNDSTGAYSSILGGQFNDATAHTSAIAGGSQNNANASQSMVVGGYNNTAGDQYDTTSNVRTSLLTLSVDSDAILDDAMIPFDTNVGYPVLDATDSITLEAGGIYVIEGTVGLVDVAGEAPFIEYAWWNVTATTWVGTSGFETSDGRLDHAGSPAHAVLAPSVTTIVELRAVDASDGPAEDSAKASAARSTVFIRRLE